MQKQLPGRPSAPSAEVVARARSKTVESLEDNDSDTPSETSGEYGKILRVVRSLRIIDQIKF